MRKLNNNWNLIGAIVLALFSIGCLIVGLTIGPRRAIGLAVVFGWMCYTAINEFKTNRDEK